MVPGKAFHRPHLASPVLKSLAPTPINVTQAVATAPNTRDPFGGTSSSTTSPSSAATTTSTLPTSSSSGPTGSTTTPTSSAHSTSSPSSTTSTSTSATPTPTPTSASSGVATTEGTSVVYVTSTQPSPSATSASHPSFLQKPSTEGGVFALVGLTSLIAAFILITWTLRKRRRARLKRDLAAAVTFDPGVMEHYQHQEASVEKRRTSGSSSGHGHGYGYGMQVQPPYVPQQEYHGHMDYGRYPTIVYNTPLANSAPSPVVPQATARGGANLTRKFSDRKPVPPLVPTNDPSNAHVSVPQQSYHQ